MIKLLSPSTEPSFNLAMEEFFLKNNTEDIFILYTDNPSIICGKHQNVLAEINLEATTKMELPVFRRLSGGGTVYHDEGNLNFCFITSGTGQNMIDFQGFTKHITNALNQLGVQAYYGGRNDLLINGNKISGNACHVYKTRVMHHGTLLFNSDLNKLGNALKTDPTKYIDKAVKSVRSKVTNISEHLSTAMGYGEFKTFLFESVFPQATQKTLTNEEISNIQNMATSKYMTWEWNYGYSPEYTFKRRFSLGTAGVMAQIEINVHKGIIQQAKLLVNKNKEELEKTANDLIGQPHRLDTIAQWISKSFTVDQAEIQNIALQLF
jgi:lipoate---protein ligase